MTDRIVTIDTADHGVVTIPEPEWCTGEMHQPGDNRVDISHNGPDTEFTLPTPRGPVVFLRMGVEQRPFTERAPGREPFLTFEVNGDWHPSDLAAIDHLAATLVERAAEVRSTGRQLAALLAGHGQPRTARSSNPAAALAYMARHLADQAAAGRTPWNNITSDSGEWQVTSQQTIGTHVVRLTATITAQEVTGR